MAINPVGQSLPLTAVSGSTGVAPSGNSETFVKILQDKLDQVQDLQQKANGLMEGFLTGQASSVHEVILAAQKAQLALQMTVEIRNRVIEAYQEISRMQL